MLHGSNRKTGPGRQQAQEGLVKSVLEYVQGMSVVKSYGLKKITIRQQPGQWMTAAKSAGSDKICDTVDRYPTGNCKGIWRGAGSGKSCILLQWKPGSFQMYPDADRFLYGISGAGKCRKYVRQSADAWESMRKANSIDDTPTMDTDGSEIRPEDASVEFKNVSFSYGDRKILDGVSIQIPAGSTTAVVGPSGGGKTTLCNLIARFWDVQGGEILVGCHNVKEYKLDSLMKNISMVFQDVYLLMTPSKITSASENRMPPMRKW